jgi:predicted outer membrane repeat protein
MRKVRKKGANGFKSPMPLAIRWCLRPLPFCVLPAAANSTAAQPPSPAKSRASDLLSGTAAIALVSAFSISLPVARQAMAQSVILVPGGTELSTLPSSDLANGNTLSLQSNVTLSGSLTVPTGSPGLTINGNNNTIAVSNSGAFVLPMNATPNFPLQNVTITGSNNTPVISGSNLGGVNIPTTGTVTFSSINTLPLARSINVISNGTFAIGSLGSTVQFLNNTEPTGGAIFVQNAGVAISGSAIFSGNTASSGSGGAIDSAGNSGFTMTGPAFTFSGNTAASGGGAIFAQNNSVAIAGNVMLSGNKALGGNGGAVDEESNSVSIGSAGSTVLITGNTASANGGAIYSQNSTVAVNGTNITIGAPTPPWGTWREGTAALSTRTPTTL